MKIKLLKLLMLAIIVAQVCLIGASVQLIVDGTAIGVNAACIAANLIFGFLNASVLYR